MNDTAGALQSSIGKKFLMAVSGIGLVVFVLMHMAGNLQMFIGQDAMNTYAVTLRKMPLLLWTARLGILLFFVIHIIDGIRLKLKNRAARPVAYVANNTVQASLASRTMMWTGIFILGFLIYHLLHFTLGVTDPSSFAANLPLDSAGRADVYTMVVLGFSNVFVSGLYISVMILLSFHLRHGASSFFQSLGWSEARWYKVTRRIGPIISFIIIAGFIAVPLGVLLNVIRLPEGGM